MRFGVLGPLLVDDGSGVRRIGAPRQRALLAALLLNQGAVVAASALADAVWDGDPPPRAATTLASYVMRLRGALGAAGERLRTHRPGYLFEAGADELDLSRFVELVERGRRAADEGRLPDALADLREALGLWRGEPLADVDRRFAQDEAQRLEELRLEAVRARVTVQLRLGQAGEVVAELAELVRQHPYREGFAAQLMLALHGSGRQVEALAVYRAARARLVDELGVEPGTELVEAHRLVLSSGPVPTEEPVPSGESLPATVPPHPPDGAPVAALEVVRPYQLPADVRDFTGRADLVKQLDDLLAGEGEGVPVATISGPGGIGKTTLAVHVAHRLRDRFPDGQLHVNLAGAGAALDPADVLGRLLRDLGVDPAAIPPEAEERAARYRTLLAGRRVLLMLDDARDAAQVRPLLPGTPGCAVLVTSRRRLADLAVGQPFAVELLTGLEALDLFAAIAGADRVAAEPGAAREVVRHCAGLPLAVRIAGSRLAARPRWTVGTLAGRLADERHRLDELHTGDLAVRASFNVSYATLPGPAERRAFRLLSLAGGQDIGVPAAAALFGRPQREAAELLERLVDVHLLESPAAGRYRMHELLRSYAADQAGDEESAPDRRAAACRLVHWYLGSAGNAAAMLGRLMTHPPVPPPDPDHPPAYFANYARAYDWCDAERANLLAVIDTAERYGRHEYGWLLAGVLFRYFQLSAQGRDWLAANEAGLRCARALGDRTAQAFMLNATGVALAALGRNEEALDRYRQALTLREELGDAQAVAKTLLNLANSLRAVGHTAEAQDHALRALHTTPSATDRYDRAHVLNTLGLVAEELGDVERAVGYLRESLRLKDMIGDRTGRGVGLLNLGQLYQRAGDPERALSHLAEAAAILHAARARVEEADACGSLGEVLAGLGRRAEAKSRLRRALAVWQELADPRAAAVRATLARLATCPG